MSIRRKIILILIGVVLFIAFWLLRPRVPNAPTERMQRETTSSLSASPPSQVIATPAVATTPRMARSEQINRAAQKANVPIKFWGKVVEPDGKPIANVSVAYGVQQAYAPWFGAITEAEKKSTIQSEVDGMFSITGEKGMMLNIRSLSKAGYILSAKAQTTFAYMGSPYLFTPHENEPVIFVMFREQMQEPIVHYHQKLYIHCDGTPIIYDLFKRKESAAGQLKISFLRKPIHIQPGQQFSWQAMFEVRGGEIMEMPQTPAYIAPESGWMKNVFFEKGASEPQWQRGFIQSFYVHTSDGKYGRINVRLTGDFEPPPTACALEVFMNPSGSRNLEPGGIK